MLVKKTNTKHTHTHNRGFCLLIGQVVTRQILTTRNTRTTLKMSCQPTSSPPAPTAALARQGKLSGRPVTLEIPMGLDRWSLNRSLSVPPLRYSCSRCCPSPAQSDPIHHPSHAPPSNPAKCGDPSQTTPVRGKAKRDMVRWCETERNGIEGGKEAERSTHSHHTSKTLEQQAVEQGGSARGGADRSIDHLSARDDRSSVNSVMRRFSCFRRLSVIVTRAVPRLSGEGRCCANK